MPILPMSCRRAAWPISVASAGSSPELEREQLARAADAVGVLARRVVAVLGGEREAVEHLELGVLELARALRARARAGDRCALQLDAEVARLQQVAHAQQHLGDVDRLGQEIACAQRQRAALRVRRDIGREHEHRHPVRLVGEEGDVLEDLGAVATRACASRAAAGRAGARCSARRPRAGRSSSRRRCSPARARIACRSRALASWSSTTRILDGCSRWSSTAQRPRVSGRIRRECPHARASASAAAERAPP